MTDLLDKADQREEAIAVALKFCATSAAADFEESVAGLCQAAELAVLSGKTVLVKPNLLKPDTLACTDPQLVAACSKYLLDLGCKVIVADSPGFGTAAGIARHIGLDRALAPLGLRLSAMGSAVYQDIVLAGQRLRLPVSRTALACDAILSLPKVKAHSQMRLTLSVKNCYGCVPGLHKALLHARFGKQREVFADLLCALYRLLPPVAAVVDGIVAMHVTGPGNGKPYPLHLLAAAKNSPLLDEVLIELLGCRISDIPLAQALRRAGVDGCTGQRPWFPMAKPSDWQVEDFLVPEVLLTTSFAPHRLLISLVRRLWAQRPRLF